MPPAAVKDIPLTPKCGERGTKCTVPYCTRKTGRTEASIVAQLKTKTGEQRKFTDTDFPPKASSLFKDASRPTPGHIAEEHIKWCRPSEFCGPNAQLFKGAEGGSADVVEEGDIEAGDVIQGMLGDCWFLGALSVCATRPELMKRLWVSIKNGKEHGIYTLAFYKDDCWHEIIVDDQIPCTMSNKPLYARCKDDEEFWVPIFEKAYAKLHQCYENLISGFVDYGMKDLTGGTPQIEKWKPEEYEDEEKPLNERAVELWEDLRSFVAQGCLMGCAFSYSGAAEAPGADGILRGHAYGLLALEEVPITREGRRETLRMLHVRNPWGKKEWEGKWSDKSGEWSEFPAVASALAHKDEEDGAFWMEYRDFLLNYNTVYVCRLFPSDWSGMRVIGRFEKDMAGGSPAKGNAEWVKNRQYHLSVKSRGPVKAVINLCQPDVRILGQAKFPLPFAFFICKLARAGERVSNKAALNQDMSSGVFKAGREVTWDGKLDPGDYAVIPMTFEKGTVGDYALMIYAKARDEEIDLEGEEDIPRDLDLSQAGASQDDASLGDMCAAAEIPEAEPETHAKQGSDVLAEVVSQLAQNMAKLSQLVDSLQKDNAALRGEVDSLRSSGGALPMGLGGRPTSAKPVDRAVMQKAIVQATSERARRYVQACDALQVRPNTMLVKEFPEPAGGVLDFTKGGNYLGSRGVLPILAVIRGDAFEELVLKGQGLLDDAAIAVAEQLKGHATVKRIDLSDNKIAVQGAIKLREMAIATPSLTEVNVTNNLIDTYTANKLRSALERNLRGGGGGGGAVGATPPSVFSKKRTSADMGKENGGAANGGAGGGDDDDPSLNARYDTAEKEAKMARVEKILEGDGFDVDEGEGEQFGAVKPWLGTVQNMVPTGFKESRAMKEACDDQLELEFVHGYRAHDARRNLFYLGSGAGDIEEIVYHAAALGIVYTGFRGESDDDMRKRKQRFFTMHDDDIIALAMHPKGQLVATGQVGKDGIIHVWDAKSMAVKATLKGFHKRGVCALAFSANGTRLVSVGLDDDHTVAVWDWMKSGAKPLGSDKGDKNKILLAEFKPGSETEFVTVGAQHMKFWTIDGSGRPSGKLGSAKGKGTSAQKAYHAVAWAKDVCVSGTTDGPLYKWQGGSATEAVDAHKGPVFALANTPDGGLVSGGKDGLVKFWTPELKCSRTVDVGKLLSANPIGAFVGAAPAIRALHARGGTVLVGTQSSQILEIEGSSVSVFMAAHGASGTWKGQAADYQGEVWGLDVKPSVGKTKKRYVTCSDDKTVRVWSVQRKSCVAVGTLSAPAKRVAWSPDGRDLVCGLLAGEVEVLDAETMQRRAKFKCASPNVAPGDISDIKFSPDGSVVAVASHDSFIYLFDVAAGYKPRSGAFRCPPKGKAHSGTVWHIDFSEDGQTLQASDNAGEILFWSVSSGTQITKVSGLRDAKWASQTCVLGWSVQGIYAPGLKLPDINAVDRSNNGQCLAIGDDFRSVQLVKYPCIADDCVRRRYKGHSEHVTNVKFTKDDFTLISTGGADLCVMQWKHTWTGMPRDEEEEDDAEMRVNYDKKMETGARRAAVTREAVGGDDDFGVDDGEGEQFGACKPWVGTVNALVPDGWAPDPKLKQEPKDNLVLEFVHGYRAHDARNNLFYLGPREDGATDQIVYHAAALGIVYDKGGHSQRFFQGHDDDVLALAVHPDGYTVATGQVGKKAPICVWDARNPQAPPLATLTGHQRGVPCLSFSRDGKTLVSVGLDDNHMVIVWDWKAKKKLGENKGGPDRVFNVDCSPHADGEFITTGAKHIKFWSGGPAKPAGKLGSAKGKGMTDQKAYHAVAWLDASTVVAGTTDGALYKFVGGTATEAIPAHQGPVFALHVTPDGSKLLSGGKDGAICVFATQGLGSGSTPAKRIDLNKLLSSDPTASVTALAPAVRALNVKGGKCVAGLMSSTVVEVDLASGSATTLMAAHGASGTFKGKAADYQGELWGLGVHPSKNEYVTCSDDCLLRFWDVASRKCTKVIKLEAQGRSACFSPDGAHVAVGLYTGDVEIFDMRRGERICKRTTGAGKIAKEELGELDYSPDGKYLAVGSHDNGIYVFSVNEDYKLAGRCKGHSSYIRHLDWNESGTAIQSDCGAYELLFWSVPSCKQNSKASSFKNEKWATQSCVIGWPVQGVFEPGMDGLDVKSVDRSKDGRLLAIGTNFRYVALAQYPCLTDDSKRKKYKGHSEFVTNVRWTPRDDYLISVGGADLCVMQWRREK
eukprot:tig00000042_g15425.t1